METWLVLLLISLGLVSGETPCVDELSNCDAYPITSCRGIYADWAKVHCRKTCVFCGNPPKVTSPPPCVDKLPNCKEFQQDTCTKADYHKWAEDNCRAYCGLCTGGPGVPTPRTPIG